MLSLSPPLQRWLAESARLIARTGSAVEWVTPLGIPIIQPYHHDSKVLVRAALTPAHPTPARHRGRPHAPAVLPPKPCRSAAASRASPSATVGMPASECLGRCWAWMGGSWAEVPSASPRPWFPQKAQHTEAEERLPAQLHPLPGLLAHDAHCPALLQVGPARSVISHRGQGLFWLLGP